MLVSNAARGSTGGVDEQSMLLQGPKFGLIFVNFGPYFQDRFPALTSARIPRPLIVSTQLPPVRNHN